MASARKLELTGFDWIELATQSELEASPPSKLIATTTQTYSLLLLKWGQDHNRVESVVAEIQASLGVKLKDLPFVVCQRMTLDDAMVGQFALVCCDCVSAFITDDLVDAENKPFFEQLLREVSTSTEFDLVTTKVMYIPDSKAAKRFCWQFFGQAEGVKAPAEYEFHRKKVRLMKLAADQCGVRMQTGSI